MKERKSAQKSERNFSRNLRWTYDKAFFQNPGRKFTEFFTGKNGFLMIKTFKNRGAIYKRKKVLTNENKKIIIGLEIKQRGDFSMNEKNKIEELDGFKLINILENSKEKDEEIKIFNTLEMIDYCLKHNVKSMIFQSIQSTNGNKFHYLSFDYTGELTNTINKEDLNNKYAVQIEKTKIFKCIGYKI